MGSRSRIEAHVGARKVAAMTAEDGGTVSESRPVEDLARVEAAHERFMASVDGLDDEGARRAIALPGWTVGHLLTHLARNADSHTRRTEAAGRGEQVEQYPGGHAGRTAEIEHGAGRPAVVLVADVESSAATMMSAWRGAPDEAWSNLTRDVGGRERPLRALPYRRWQELEVHVVDLDRGVTHRDWSDDFVAAQLAKLRREGPERRLPPGASMPAPGLLDERDELAWLYGRLSRPDLPELSPWS